MPYAKLIAFTWVDCKGFMDIVMLTPFNGLAKYWRIIFFHCNYQSMSVKKSTVIFWCMICWLKSLWYSVSVSEKGWKMYLTFWNISIEPEHELNCFIYEYIYTSSNKITPRTLLFLVIFRHLGVACIEVY